MKRIQIYDELSKKPRLKMLNSILAIHDSSNWREHNMVIYFNLDEVMDLVEEFVYMTVESVR